MGLIDFVLSAGEKLFGGGAEAEAKAEAERGTALIGTVNRLGFEVDDLKIDVAKDVATVYGKTPTQAVREKIILAVGNTAGVGAVDDRLRVLKPEPEAAYYTVKSGDTLSKIANNYYSDAMKYPVIFDANKPMLTDPDKIYPGQVLRIPPQA